MDRKRQSWKGRPFELATLEDMAHKYWNWVVKQDNSRTEERVKNGREVGGACIVAVLGDRKSRKFTAATIPRSLNKNLLRDGPNKAPVWFNGAKNEGRIKENGEGLLHAEDFALFLWEAESNSGESISRTQNKYLDNPIMAVWGETGRHAGDLKDDIPPCKQCRRILDALGVGYKNHNAGRSSPEYSGPEDEDMLEAGDCDENNQQNEENDQQSHDSDSTRTSARPH